MSRLLLDEYRLKLLLEEHRDDIGRKAVLSDVFAGIVFVSQSIFATYFDLIGVPGVIWKCFFILFGSAFAIRGAILSFKAFRNMYTHKKLFEEIYNMNEITHPFSIVAMRDGYNKYPNKFLLYYDEAWACWFFPNFRTREPETDNIENIRGSLSAQLKVPQTAISLEMKGETIHEKYSKRDHRTKVYDHKLYDASISAFPETLRQNRFAIDGREYAWMSIADMEGNPDIQKNNSDVVSFVKEYSAP